MRVTMVDAISINGKITEGSNPHPTDWTSAEDKTHFRRIVQTYDAIISGRRTHEIAGPKPDPGKLRIVMTRRPAEFAAETVPGAIEFTSDTPAEVIEDLWRRGRQNVLVAGGGEVNSLFLAAGLVDELYLTIEPVLFGTGTELLGGGELSVQARLISVEQLNDRGTVLMHYDFKI